MVAFPERSEQVRICVDLTKLSNAVLHEIHILPSVDHVLRQMAGLKYSLKSMPIVVFPKYHSQSSSFRMVDFPTNAYLLVSVQDLN